MEEEKKGLSLVRDKILENAKPGPSILTIGSLLWKITAEFANIDFILSFREEKIAMLFQALLNYGWLILLIFGVAWLIESAVRSDSHPSPLASVGVIALISFMFGTLLSAHAAGSLPAVLTGWSGDSVAEICGGTMDTSRLIGLKDKFRLVLICGVGDPSIDPHEDTRISVSSLFHITGAQVTVNTPLGKVKEVWSKLPPLPAGQNYNVMLWHAVALVPNDIDPTSIRKVADVERQGGRMVTDPAAGGFGSGMGVPNSNNPPVTALLGQQNKAQAVDSEPIDAPQKKVSKHQKSRR